MLTSRLFSICCHFVFYPRIQRTERIRDYFVGLVCYGSVVLYKCLINNNNESYQRVSHSFCGGFESQNFIRLQWGLRGRIFVSAAVGPDAAL